MISDRDRLIELCENLILSCKSSLCEDCEHKKIDYPHCMSVHFADYLLANGVAEERNLIANLEHRDAEIFRLREEIERLKAEAQMADGYADALVEKTKSEAYKEFAEKVKEEIAEALKSNYKARSEREQKIPIYTENEFLSYCSGKIDCLRGLDDFLDNLLKELVGEDNTQ